MLLVSGHVAVATTARGVSEFQYGKYEEALKFLVLPAQKCDAAAMFALSQMYATGLGVAKNWEKSVDYFHKAASVYAGNVAKFISREMRL